jgi:glutamate-1-semialdehyde 2,1-aminomutase
VIGEKLRTALNQAINTAGLPGACTGIHANPAVSLEIPSGVNPRQISTLFIQEMARRGVHTYMSFKATLAHSDSDIAQTAEVAYQALRVIKSGLENNALDHLLVADLKKEPLTSEE